VLGHEVDDTQFAPVLQQFDNITGHEFNSSLNTRPNHLRKKVIHAKPNTSLLSKTPTDVTARHNQPINQSFCSRKRTNKTFDR